MVKRIPKFTPEASNIMLFGPGVIEETKAKPIRANSRSGFITVFFPFRIDQAWARAGPAGAPELNAKPTIDG
jgi:hypothetical protein